MGLWVESSHRTSLGVNAEPPGDVVSTFTTEEQFAAVMIGCGPATVGRVLAQRSLAQLAAGTPMDAAVESLLPALPAGEHMPLAMLHVLSSGRASLAEVDAPPLFLTHRDELVLLPVLEEELGGRLVRRCDFVLGDGDHLAMVSESYVVGAAGRGEAVRSLPVGFRAEGAATNVLASDRRQSTRDVSPGNASPLPFPPWSWAQVALSVRRLTGTRCDAEQLARALVRIRHPQPATRNPQPAITVLAMLARPIRTVTVWSGPPADRRRDREMLDRLMAEPGMRVICGDTTAEIAARLAGAELVIEPPPDEGWSEVPPVSRMVGPDGSEPVALVTEGVVTLGVARRRLAEVQRQHPEWSAAQSKDLASRQDGASRLAHLLFTADKVRFLVGLATNPAQTAKDGKPLRLAAVRQLMEDLRAQGKIVVVEYV